MPRQPQFGPSHNLDEFIILRKAYKYKSSLRCTGTGSRIPLLLNIVVIPNALHVLRPQTDTERRRLFWLFFIVLCFIYVVLLLRAVFLVVCLLLLGFVVCFLGASCCTVAVLYATGKRARPITTSVFVTDAVIGRSFPRSHSACFQRPARLGYGFFCVNHAF